MAVLSLIFFNKGSEKEGSKKINRIPPKLRLELYAFSPTLSTRLHEFCLLKELFRLGTG
jgi:hypothetical protein